MKIKYFLPFVVISFSLFFFTSCQTKHQQKKEKLRNLHDTIGFAQYKWQMDSIYKRFQLKDTKNNKKWKAVICPHDDYKYAGKLYYEALKGINANTIILIGVAHKAKKYNLKDKIIFGNFTHWKSPYGKLPISSLNKEIYSKLPKEDYLIHDDMQQLEHSLEAIIPFFHKKNRNVEIVPILVPYINSKNIDIISTDLSNAIYDILKSKNLIFGEDLAIIISNDAVHYGDVEWSQNLAPYGVDSLGTSKARKHDLKIINSYLVNEVNMAKIDSFFYETTQREDYTKYNWVWCGRYAVPFGLATANKLNILQNKKPLKGTFLKYETSIDHPLITVEDLQMGTTAIATQRHWVGYASIKYE
ncbi:AmmeMemoRadiSam system protein B [Lutibacter sp.]|uniref:AmmeMemoRadiSam system protein B n=1 Tax=Lutibacter sp. TaxID=1925666 RepID=UPI0025BCFC5E|nr:AmmeMemoRadiSam system protein B [Lutibacter sp.]MCF6167577.1 AmmeMemoRadiSam system protein B [Lutibacter sp.]